MKIFTYIIIIIVVGAVIAGFFVVGSPKEERLRRFDERRIQDLQSLQNEIVNYWQSKAKLPERLPELVDNIRGFTVPRDPETSSEYGYQIKGELEFALCATFDRASILDTASISGSTARVTTKAPYPVDNYSLGQNWDHSPGYVCFDRKIDKDIYKLQKTD